MPTYPYPYFTVKQLRISKTSANGVDITKQLENIEKITIPHTSKKGPIPSSVITYDIEGRQELSDSYIFTVSIKGGLADTSGSNETNKSIILEPYISENFTNSDYNALFNNASTIANAANVQRVDYSTNPNTPVNIYALRNNVAEKAEVQELLYNSPGLISGRYSGQQLQGQAINEYNTGDKSFGKTPVIESTTPYFCIFDYISGFSPEHNQANAIVLSYIVDEQGNFFTPDATVALPTVQQGFPAGSEFEVSIQAPSIGGSEATLLGTHTVLKPASRLEPILFSYTAASYLNPVYSIGNRLEFDTDPNLDTYDVKASNTNQSITNLNIGNVTQLLFPTEVKDDAGYFSTGTSKYLFSADSEQPVKFTGNFTVEGDGWPNSFGSDPGVATIKIQLATDGGNFLPAYTTVIGSRTFEYQDFIPKTVIVTSPYRNFSSGNAVRMVVEIEDRTTELTFNTSLLTATSLESGSSYIGTGSDGYFFNTGSNANYTVLTASLDLSGKYEAFYVGVSGSSSQGFNSVNLPFTVQVGDEIKFNNDERKVFMVTSVETPEENTVGRLYISLDGAMNKSMNKDFFAIRRYVDTSTMILMNVDKVAGTQNTGILFPKYPSARLKANYETIISNLKNKGIL